MGGHSSLSVRLLLSAVLSLAGASLAEDMPDSPDPQALAKLGPCPAGYVSLDDSEVMQLSQAGVSPYPGAQGRLEMGGRGTSDEDHIVTEAAIRAFYAYYRRVMEL